MHSPLCVRGFSAARRVFTLVAVLVALATASVHAGVVSHWTFDTDFIDATSAHDAVVGGGAPAVTTADGRFGGGALDLNGSSWLNAGSWSFGGSYTLSTWVKPSNVADDWRGFFGKHETSGEKVFWLGQQSGDGRIRFGNYYNGVSESALDAGYSISNGQWTHVAASWDEAADTQTVYINGRQVAQVVRPGANQQAGNTRLQIGAVGTAVTNIYAGLMDEAWVFDQALTEQQVKNLMATNDIATAAAHTVQATYDFEGGLAGWTPLTTGVPGDNQVFTTPNNQPAVRPHSGGYEPNTIEGNAWIRTWEGEVIGSSDGHTGIIETAPFVLGTGARFDLMIGGGAHAFSGDPDAPGASITAVTLEREVSPGDWEAIRTVSGRNVNFLSPVTWKVDAHEGETVRLRIYDTHTGGWGHVASDNIIYSTQSQGQVGYWNFNDGTANDSADSHHGTFRGDATTAAGGQGGRHLRLDGDGDYVDTGRWDLGGKFTVSAWIDPDNVAADWRGFLSKNSINGENVFWFGQHSGDGRVRFGNYLTGSTAETYLDTAGVVVGNDKWQHVAATYDGHFQCIYVNGNLVAISVDRNAYQETGDAPLLIGRIQHDWGVFDGDMDEVRVHNYALGEAGVESLMGPVIAQFGSLELKAPVATRATWGYTAIDGTGKLRLDVPDHHDAWSNARGLAPFLVVDPPAGDFIYETRVTTDNQTETQAGLVVYDTATDNFAYILGWGRDSGTSGGVRNPQVAMHAPGQYLGWTDVDQDSAVLRLEKVGNTVTGLAKLSSADPYWREIATANLPAGYQIGVAGKAWSGNSLRADFDYLATGAYVAPTPVTNDGFDSAQDGWRLSSPGNSTVDLTTNPGHAHFNVPGNNDIWTTRRDAPLLLTDAPAGDYVFETHVATDGVQNTIAGLVAYDNTTGNYAYSLGWAADPNEGGSAANPQVVMNSSTPGRERLGKRFINPGQTDVLLRFEKVGDRLTGLYKLDAADPFWRQAATAAHIPLSDCRIGLMGKTWTGNALQADFDYFRAQPLSKPLGVDKFGSVPQDAWIFNSPGSATADLTSRPGWLHVDTPSGHDMWTSRGLGPVLYTRPPDSPTYYIETHVDMDGSDRNSMGGLCVYDMDRDNFALSWALVMGSGGAGSDVRFQYPGGTIGQQATAVTEAWLRLEHNADEWAAFYKFDEADPWTLLNVAIEGEGGMPVIGDPRVGLLSKTWGGNSGGADAYFDYFHAQIPEPATLSLAALGLAGLALRRRRRRNA